jgi:hypothetical protein
MHGISPIVIPPVSEPTIAVAYHLSMPTHPLASVRCPVPACPASFKTRSRLRSHFACRHPQDTLLIAEEGPLLQCPRCGLHSRTMGSSYYRERHFRTKACRAQAARRATRAQYARQVREAFSAKFYVNGQPIERVAEYQYLGRIISFDDSDTPAVSARLALARAKWGRMSKVLSTQTASPRVMGKFYTAVLQAILLYGCESWVIPKRTLQRLDAFHHRCARHIAHRHIRRHPDGTWAHPHNADVLRICGLQPISTYIYRRKSTLRRSYAEKSSSLYQRCKQLPSTPSSARHLVWWR